MGRGDGAAAAPSEALPVVSGKVLPANSEPGSQGGAQRELVRKGHVPQRTQFNSEEGEWSEGARTAGGHRWPVLKQNYKQK